MAATENSSVLGLLAAVLSAERAQQAAADVGGADALEGFAWLRTVLLQLSGAREAVRAEQAARENDRVNHEQRLNDLEAQFLGVTATNTELKVQLESQAAATAAASAELRDAQARAAAASAKSQELAAEAALQRQKLSFMQQETEMLAAVADRKQGTIDQLRQELERAKAAAAAASEHQSGQVRDLFAQRSDASLRSKVEFLEKERALLQESTALLEERHARLTEQFVATKEALTTRNKELEALLPHREAELAARAARVAALEQERDTMASALESARAKLREQQEQHAASTSTLSQKAAKYEELAGTLQASLTEAEALMESLRRRHDQYRQSTAARQAEDRELVQTFQRDAAAKSKAIDELKAKVAVLENDLAVRMQAVGGGAGGGGGGGGLIGQQQLPEPSAMIQKLVQVTGSGALADWYNRLVVAEQERDKNIREKRHLHQLMNNILAAIEQQGPILSAQSEDYKRALESQQDLAEQIRELDAENAALREEVAAARQVETRNKALQKTLAVLEEASRRALWAGEGGGRVKPHADAMQRAVMVAASGGSGSGGVDAGVSKHLAEYSTLAELSLKHTHLLQAFHELQATVDSRRDEALRTADIEQQVRDFQKQLQAVVKARERSQREIQSLVQQRDALKAALANTDRSYLLAGGGGHAGAVAGAPAAGTAAAAAAALRVFANTGSSGSGSGSSSSSESVNPPSSDSSPADSRGGRRSSEAQAAEVALLSRHLKATQEAFDLYVINERWRRCCRSPPSPPSSPLSPSSWPPPPPSRCRCSRALSPTCEVDCQLR
jgi:DNA repair exonuclease SbcCD ATPase subunit